MRSTPISHCRICGGEGLSEVFGLGDLASCGVFPSKTQPDAPKAPLTLVQCGGCGLVQLAHNFRGDDLFRHSYGYRSGINESMVRHLRDIASTVMQRAKFAAGDIVLDIGGMDGTYFSFFGNLGGVSRTAIDRSMQISSRTISPASRRSAT